MLKDYLKQRNISMYRVAEESGVPYSTVNDLANGRVDIDKCQVSLLRLIASTLEMSMDELYELCRENRRYILDRYGVVVDVVVKNKDYYAEFDFQGEHKSVRICAVNDETTHFIKDLAKWSAEDCIKDVEWEKINEIFFNEKRRGADNTGHER